MTTGRMLGLIVGLALSGAASGALVFERKMAEVEADPGVDKLTVEFPFTVTGDKPVRIIEYEASCSCLEAKISGGGKLVWKPGESGTVMGIFEMGTFKGTVEKPILLRVEGQPGPVRLSVRVHIPVLVEVDPVTLFWDQGGAGDSKVIKIKVNHEEPIHVTEVSGTNPQFSHELKKIRDGREYELVVTPKTVERRAFGLLRIRTDSDYRRHQSYQAYVVVRRPKPDTGRG